MNNTIQEISKDKNILTVNCREYFRVWLFLYAEREDECWVEVKRGRPTDADVFYYLDAVEEALCFGWIDSMSKLIDGRRMQRFTPRKKNSSWTELNKERANVRRMEQLREIAELLKTCREAERIKRLPNLLEESKG